MSLLQKRIRKMSTSQAKLFNVEPASGPVVVICLDAKLISDTYGWRDSKEKGP